jgi:hypothetical protein
MSLSDYFRAQAAWRRQKATEYPDDPRNAASADALGALADYCDAAADSTVEALAPHLSEGCSLGGEETQRQVIRYGFWSGQPLTDAHHETFLDELLVTCLQDAYAFAGEHGQDWTGTLHDFEVEAATNGTYVPSDYFARRERLDERERALEIRKLKLPTHHDLHEAMADRAEAAALKGESHDPVLGWLTVLIQDVTDLKERVASLEAQH